MLEVAASAVAGVATWGHDTIRGGFEHLDRIGPQELLAALGDADAHPLARQRVTDEDHLSVQPSHTVTPMSNGADLDDGQLVIHQVG